MVGSISAVNAPTAQQAVNKARESVTSEQSSPAQDNVSISGEAQELSDATQRTQEIRVQLKAQLDATLSPTGKSLDEFL